MANDITHLRPLARQYVEAQLRAFRERTYYRRELATKAFEAITDGSAGLIVAERVAIADWIELRIYKLSATPADEHDALAIEGLTDEWTALLEHGDQEVSVKFVNAMTAKGVVN